MLTKQQLEQDGWTFEAAEGTASHADGRQVVTTADQAPLFFLIRAVSDLQGDSDLQNEPVTAGLVAQVSAETWTPEV